MLSLSFAGGASAQSLPPDYPFDNADIETVTVNVTADTSVLSLAPTKNYGSSRTLDANRTLVTVDLAAFRNAIGSFDYIESAKLRFTLTPSLLPRLPRTVTAHKVLKAWTENGATYHCAVDSNTSNSKNDCSGPTAWNMNNPVDAFNPTPSGSATLPLFRFGTVDIDVTKDVNLAGTYNTTNPNGWLIKTNDFDISTLADFNSRETSTPPQLVIRVRHCNRTVCDDGSGRDQCLELECGEFGECEFASAPPIASCNDNNACTTNDLCGQDSNCAGTPVVAGTPCGSGLACDATGQCVASPN